MVYIYKKRIGNKFYYYLRASVRKEKRVVIKDLAYLGNSVEDVRKKLDNLSQYKEEIKKAYRTINNFLESDYYIEKVKKLRLKKDDFLEEKLIQVESCKYHYLKTFQKKHELTKKETYKNFLIEFAFNTVSIEGNTINLKEARNLLEEGLTPEGKTLREIYDLQNTERVFFEILKSTKKLSHDFIINIHKKLLKNIDNRVGYRTGEVRVWRARFKSSPVKYVQSDMDLLLKWYRENEKKLHPLVLAVLFHHKFEKIHPFMDGNGRVGRILLNYILIRKGYPPLIIRKKFRKDYLDSLEKADKSNLLETKKEIYKDLVQFIADEMILTYWSLFL